MGAFTAHCSIVDGWSDCFDGTELATNIVYLIKRYLVLVFAINVYGLTRIVRSMMMTLTMNDITFEMAYNKWVRIHWNLWECQPNVFNFLDVGRVCYEYMKEKSRTNRCNMNGMQQKATKNRSKSERITLNVNLFENKPISGLVKVDKFV